MDSGITDSAAGGGDEGSATDFSTDSTGGGFFLFLGLLIGLITRGLSPKAFMPYSVVLLILGILMGVLNRSFECVLPKDHQGTRATGWQRVAPRPNRCPQLLGTSFAMSHSAVA